jgi:hypothetical protein
MHHERRHSERQPVGFYVEQFLDEELLRYFATDLSMRGLYLERPASERVRRTNQALQLEIRLPRVAEPIWACGEVVYERVDSLFVGCGVRFTALTPAHALCLRDWLRECARTEKFITHPARRALAVASN